jgi:hypothetical protein
VTERAQHRCEYCLLHQDDTTFTHPIDHIVAIKHGGTTDETNLALSCIDCNRNKGSDLTSIDPATGEITPLFNPRRDDWHEHFRLQDATVVGVTAAGRTTVYLLQMNESARVTERGWLIVLGRYP